MNAYEKIYLEDAMHNIGIMFDWAINNFGCSPEEFCTRLSASGVSERLSRGYVDVLVGKSGIELAVMVLQLTGTKVKEPVSPLASISSPEYWAGSSLAYYQWKSGRSFCELADLGLSFSVVLSMFNPFHEADLSTFESAADSIIGCNASKAGWLKAARKRVGLTQEELSKVADVPLCLIRAYEQGTIDTDCAEYATISKLKRCLGVR